jgi:uncharacterized protein YcnI
MPASAHIGIRPGVDATGSTTTALTSGQSGVLSFRIGHGCTAAETNLVDPSTGKSLTGTKWGTHVFSVTVPVLAQGEGGATVPKPQYVPGFRTSLTKSPDGNYTVTWTAISRDFDIPDGPEVAVDSGIAATMYADFGIQIKWALAAKGQTVFFPSKQTCIMDIPGKKGAQKTHAHPQGIPAVPASTHTIYNSWDVTDGSGADSIPDDTEHNTAPSVVVK